ncbi:hypothetical protein HK405_000896 [Cladochytrium tenue]|nr:hypothetical protein HK405_000896 [Cladochytrium tenue]
MLRHGCLIAAVLSLAIVALAVAALPRGTAAAPWPARIARDDKSVDLEAEIQIEVDNGSVYFLPSDEAERKRLHMQARYSSHACLTYFASEPVGWNGPIGKLCAEDLRQALSGSSKRFFMRNYGEAEFDRLIEEGFQQAGLAYHNVYCVTGKVKK